MITATSKKWGTIKVHGLCNKGESFGEPWLIVIRCGYTSFCLIAIAHNPQDALDVYADSRHARLTKMEKPPLPEEENWYTQLGNFGEWHDLTNTTLFGCTVNYFAKKDDLDL